MRTKHSYTDSEHWDILGLYRYSWGHVAQPVRKYSFDLEWWKKHTPKLEVYFWPPKICRECWLKNSRLTPGYFMVLGNHLSESLSGPVGWGIPGHPVLTHSRARPKMMLPHDVTTTGWW